MNDDKCTDCKGTGKQIFHGYFESIMGRCNFCGGSGKREDQIKTYENLGKKDWLWPCAPEPDTIDNNFKYHAPKEGQPEIYNIIRESGKAMAECIDRHCPGSREKSLAMTKLEESVMWANAAIARSNTIK